ncbi:MAG: hypothetical protein R2881_01235 [Eubacteriales bacterium]
MQAVVFVIRHQIDKRFDGRNREKVAADVDEKTAPRMLRRVIDDAMRQMTFVLRDELHKRACGIHRTRDAARLDEHAILMHANGVRFLKKRAVEPEFCF